MFLLSVNGPLACGVVMFRFRGVAQNSDSAERRDTLLCDQPKMHASFVGLWLDLEKNQTPHFPQNTDHLKSRNNNVDKLLASVPAHLISIKKVSTI